MYLIAVANMWPEPSNPNSRITMVYLALFAEQNSKKHQDAITIFIWRLCYISRRVYLFILRSGGENYYQSFWNISTENETHFPNTLHVSGQVSTTRNIIILCSCVVCVFGDGIVLANVESPHIYSELPTSWLVDEETRPVVVYQSLSVFAALQFCL